MFYAMGVTVPNPKPKKLKIGVDKTKKVNQYKTTKKKLTNKKNKKRILFVSCKDIRSHISTADKRDSGQDI